MVIFLFVFVNLCNFKFKKIMRPSSTMDENQGPIHASFFLTTQYIHDECQPMSKLPNDR